MLWDWYWGPEKQKKNEKCQFWRRHAQLLMQVDKCMQGIVWEGITSARSKGSLHQQLRYHSKACFKFQN